MSNKEYYYPESRFGGFTDVDGTIAFFNMVNSLLVPSFVVLDVGCGRGHMPQVQFRLVETSASLREKLPKS